MANGIGVIGLGNIGGAIATNLVADGRAVMVHDADAGRAEAVAGAVAAGSVTGVAKGSEVTLLSLPTPTVVDEVAVEWAGAAATGSILVDLSTNRPASVRALGARLGQSGHHLVEAPLTGGAIGAEKRLLVFMVGGDDEPVARARAVLEPLGRALFHVGALGLGNTMKLVNSLLAFTTTWVSLEGLSVAAKAGIAVPDAVEILRTAGASNFYIDRMVETIDQRGRPTQFALALAAKDAGLIAETSDSLDIEAPVAHAMAEVLRAAVAAGLGDADWSELVALAERQGDLELRWDA
jgi:3-hydroxyisobutyrate dehydrogenase-like beta-hydroxyacid dehydrogenase